MKHCSKALTEFLYTHFSMHLARYDVMAQLILGIVKMGSVQLTTLSRVFDSQAKSASTLRRLQRFFVQQKLSWRAVANAILALKPPPDKLILTMDRTNWAFGSLDINFLVVGYVVEGITIPLVWLLLDHKGNSDTDTRVLLLQRALSVLGDRPIHCFLADREFIGKAWFSTLRDMGVSLCIRIKNTTLLRHSNGGTRHAKTFFEDLSQGESRTLATKLWGKDMQITGLRLASGELLIVAVSPPLTDIHLPLYAQRWTIECLFKSLKTHGFFLESTHLKHHDRLSKLMSLCAIAFAWCVKVGSLKHSLKPISIKNHTRRLVSIFTYGFQALQCVLNKASSAKKYLPWKDFFAFLFSPNPLPAHLVNLTVVY